MFSVEMNVKVLW